MCIRDRFNTDNDKSLITGSIWFSIELNKNTHETMTKIRII